ncbi:exonuclease domain-containing protein [Microvirga tunisiensis]|nr:exonuclease domain-containing protein [Microvirga tunisiensis]
MWTISDIYDEENRTADGAEWWHAHRQARMLLGQATIDAFEDNDTDYPSRVIDWTVTALHLGGADAAYRVGMQYHAGDIVDEDRYEAARWFRVAAELGHAEAAHLLGDFLESCWIWNGDLEAGLEAAKWYQVAVDRGHAPAQAAQAKLHMWLAEHYDPADGEEPNPAEALRWYNLAAASGHVDAQFRLAQILAEESPDTNSVIAFSWFLKAATQGHAEAQWHVATMYADGNGVTRDLGEAARWFRAAAEQDHADAQNMIGCCYLDGDGVPQDYSEALDWFNRAMANGSDIAAYNLGSMHLNGWGTLTDLDQALLFFRKAAETGDEDALRKIDELTRPPPEPNVAPAPPPPVAVHVPADTQGGVTGKRYVVLDFETSGLSPARGDRVIEVGAVEVIDGRIGRQYQSLANPGFPISARITEITTITNAMLRTAPPVEQVMRELAAFIEGATLVAHNAPFDLKFLQAELERLDLWDECDILCTLQLGRRTCPGLPSYKLRELAIHLGVELPDTFHRAMADAMTAAHIFVRIQTPTGSATIDLFRDPPRQPEPPRIPAVQPAPMPPPVQTPAPPATPPPPRDPVPPPTAPQVRDEPPSMWNRIVRVFR